MKKKFLITGLCLAFSIPFVLSGCNNPKTKTFSADEIYGFGAVSTVKLLGSETTAAALKSLSEVTVKETEAENGVKGQIDKFNEYFLALDSFLGKDVVSTTSVTNTDPAFAYQTKLTIRGKDFDGNDTQYVMYYTETKRNETIEGDEIQTLYSLTGVMVIDEKQYNLEGRRTEEQERDENEAEIQIIAYQNDRANRIEMVQEHSTETGEVETEYVYSVFINDKLQEKTSVEFEVENKHNKQETGYEIEFISGTNRGKYSIEREIKNQVIEIEVEYNLDGQTGKFVIREIESQGQKYYEYTFSDGTKETYERH